MFFSVIIPLFNRPQEIDELLQSLTEQRYQKFEVIIVEDGSTKAAKDIVEKYVGLLDVHYYAKPNEGQGFARNYGFERAKGDYFIVFDSDILVPPDYFDHVLIGLQRDRWDAFGGPDAAHSSFTAVQKAISYSMTSPFTTGGIRGNKAHIGPFHPRSFNMGLSKEVYNATQGFKLPRRSEDIEFSVRMIDMGFRVGLISAAFVYHKRRATFVQFFKQTNFFGKGRIDIYQLFPKELKPVHALPTVFVLGLAVLILLNVLNFLLPSASAICLALAMVGNILLFVYTLLLFLHACFSTKSVWIGLLSVLAAYTQLIAYGTGFLGSYVEKVLLKK